MRSTTAARTAAARWLPARSTARRLSAPVTARASPSPTERCGAAQRPPRSRRTRFATSRAASRSACDRPARRSLAPPARDHLGVALVPGPEGEHLESLRTGLERARHSGRDPQPVQLAELDYFTVEVRAAGAGDHH